MSLKKKAVYLDSNAEAPLHPRVVEELQCLFLGSSPSAQQSTPPSELQGPSAYILANPSSIHSDGRAAKRLLSEARERVAYSMGGHAIDPEELTFTSSGTEANQMVIRSQLERGLSRFEHPHWILSEAEHDSVLELVQWFEIRGGVVEKLPIDPSGQMNLDAETLQALLRPETVLMSLIWVNNETGVINPMAPAVEAIQKVSQEGVTYLHVDAAQAWGKIPVDVHALGADAVTFSGHKIGAPAGTGVVWLKPRRALDPLIFGNQEKGRRGGTENLFGIHLLGVAAAAIDVDRHQGIVKKWRDWLETEAIQQIDGLTINGLQAPRVENTTHFSFEGLSGESLVLALDLAGFSVSSGSACSSGTLEPSHVLMAMGKTREEAMAAIRVSFCPWLLEGQSDETIEEDLKRFLQSLQKSVKRMRAVAEESQSRVHYGADIATESNVLF